MPRVTVNGLSIHYAEGGEGAPLLLLHGLGSGAADWLLQMPEFSAHFRVIAPDLRGHGHSDKPPGPYSIAEMAADVAELQEALGASPAHVLGLSMGGMVALQLAADYPAIVYSLVIANSVPALAPRNVSERLRLWQRLALARTLGPARSGRFLSRRLFPKPEQEAYRQLIAERWAENDADAYLASMRACIDWSVVDRLGEIHCPVLVISGDEDYLPLDAKRELAERLPDGRLLLIADSRHATPIDQPEAFNRAVLDFLLPRSGLYSEAHSDPEK